MARSPVRATLRHEHVDDLAAGPSPFSLLFDLLFPDVEPPFAPAVPVVTPRPPAGTVRGHGGR